MNIYQILDKLGIRHNNYAQPNGFIVVSCPFGTHEDSTPSAGVHKETGIINCFSCKQTSNITKLIQNRFRCSYKEAEEYLKDFYPAYLPSHNAIIEKEKEKDVKKEFKLNLILSDFDPLKFKYTLDRGFTKEFNEKYNIKLCLSHQYENYFIIPIIDTDQNIHTFEARKLKQYEILKQKNVDLSDYRLKDGKIYKDSELVFDHALQYLLQPKVLYPAFTRNKETIFNADNIEYDKDLILSEGFASLPKLEQVFTNCSCSFGSSVTQHQIKFLKRFKKDIVILPDGDMACFLMLEELNKYLSNIKIIDIDVKDDGADFITQLKSAHIITIGEYLLKLKHIIEPVHYELKSNYIF